MTSRRNGRFAGRGGIPYLIKVLPRFTGVLGPGNEDLARLAAFNALGNWSGSYTKYAATYEQLAGKLKEYGFTPAMVVPYRSQLFYAIKRATTCTELKNKLMAQGYFEVKSPLGYSLGDAVLDALGCSPTSSVTSPKAGAVTPPAEAVASPTA